MTSFSMTKPDDWHVHLRDGAMLEAVLPFTARQFGRATVMPNLGAAGDDALQSQLNTATGFCHPSEGWDPVISNR